MPELQCFVLCKLWFYYSIMQINRHKSLLKNITYYINMKSCSKYINFAQRDILM